jgi:RNA polymerase sigma-70 factor (ECF subfamily)
VPTTERSDDVFLFDSVYRCHYRVVYAYLFGQIQEEGLATDLLQDTFVRVWGHVDELRRIPAERRLYWILGIARNILYDQYRRRKVRSRVEHSSRFAAEHQPSDPQQELETSETQRLLDAAIRALPDSWRIPLTLSAMGGLNSVEIAQVLSRPAGTVRYQIAEARKRIAREVGLTAGGKQEGKDR